MTTYRISPIPFVCALILMALVASADSDASRIPIRKGTVNRTKAAVPDMTVNGKMQMTRLSKELTDAIRFDLDNSGWFDIIGNNAAMREALSKDLATGALNVALWRKTDATIEMVIKTDLKASGDSYTITVRAYDIGQEGGRSVLEKAFSLKTKDPRYLAHYVSDQIVEGLTRGQGIARTRVAFVANKGAKEKHLYIMDYDGKNVRKISNFRDIRGNMIVVAPDWAPNGQAVYFTSYHLGYPYVFKIDFKTWKMTAVSTFPGLNASAAVSPNGSEIALCLSKTGSVEIHKMVVGSKNSTRLTYAGRGVAAVPRWSPDGGKIAYVSGKLGVPQIFVMSANGTNERRLIKGYSNTTSLDWSPRGDLIAFSATIRGRSQIFVADVKTGDVDQITSDMANNSHPSFAPDGIHLMYTKEVNYSSNIHMIDVRDKRDVAITNWAGDETYPSWSPVSFDEPFK